MARLQITTKYGTWKQAPVNPLRLVDVRRWWTPKGGKFDKDGYLIGGTAITVMGTNRYNGQPVDSNGATFDLWFKVHEFIEAFPDLPKKRPGSVDRRQNHDPNAPVSKHAKSRATDQYPWSITRTWEFINWLDAEMDKHPVKVSVDGVRTQAGVEDWVWYEWTRRAGEKRRRLKPTSNQHRDHAHISVGIMVDRRKQTTKPPPAKDPRRTLRYRIPKMKGEDVKLVQQVVGAKVYPPGVGVYGPATEAAVKAWQAAQGITVDGVWGPESWAKYDEVTAP